MPTSGLVVTLSTDPEKAAAAESLIEGDPRFELGPLANALDDANPCPRYPVVLVAATGDACEDAVRELQAALGVELVDVVSVDISDLTAPPASLDTELPEDRP